MEYTLAEIQKMVNRDPRVKKGTKPILITGGLIAFGLILVVPLGFIVDRLIYFGLLVIGVGIIVILGLAIRTLFIQKKVRAEIMARLEREEEDRLAKVKATMTPAEWEAYKLQLENNKLLKDIKRRSSQKSTTTTTYGFTEGV
jgi:heme exporter protein D